jgi:uncharacterized Zn finger protein
VILNDGKSIVVTSARDRIGHGPWARLFASAVVGDEGSSVAERGRALARAGAVHTVHVARGELSASVDDASVSLRADPVPARIWSIVAKSSLANARLAAAVAGREQSVHLEHLMASDWEEPLIPRAPARACTCDEAGVCEHVAALAYVVADLIDGDPSLLLRWRGCDAAEPAPVVEARGLPVAPNEGAWRSDPLPASRPLRPLPVGAVLMCLGESGLPAGGRDLRDTLQQAYASFSRT